MKTEQSAGDLISRIEAVESDPYQKVIEELEDGMAKLMTRYRDLFMGTRQDSDQVEVGRERVVLVRDDHVLKFPLSEEGVLSNAEESDWTSEEVPIADCEIVWMDGLPVLRMEKVDPVLATSSLPDWTDLVDCRQVGRTADGRLVAYDL